jgi:hypothetical protein
MTKILSFVTALLIGLTLTATPAKAAPYGGCDEAGRYAGSYGAFQCLVNAKADDESWVVKATRDKGQWGVQVRTDDGSRWTVRLNGKVVDSWKHRGLRWWEVGSVVRNTFLDFDVDKHKRVVVTVERDGERVYRSGVFRGR